MVLSKIVTMSIGMKISKKLVGNLPPHFHDFVHKITKSNNCEFGYGTKTCKSPNNFDNVRFVIIDNIHEQLFVSQNITSSNKAIDFIRNLHFE
jgi:hypothetical protein